MNKIDYHGCIKYLKNWKGEDMVDRLLANGDINYWDDEIEKAAKEDKKCVRVNVLLQRGENHPKVLKFNFPRTIFWRQNRNLCIKYLTASIYNEVVCEGAANIIFFMEDKHEEQLLSNVVANELNQNYTRMNIYGNYGDEIKVTDSSNLNYHFAKELQPYVILSPENEKQKYCIGVDVGGTSIKTVIIEEGKPIYRNTVQVEMEGGGKLLKHQILLEIMKANVEVEKRGHIIECLGLTFPSPIKRGRDGSFKIIRLTNYERYWKSTRGGNDDFAEDYKELNSIVNEIKKYDITNVEVMNDADAFGFGEIFFRISQCKNDKSDIAKMGTKVVLPIGTGPGYVKIKNGIIENIPNQGGHLVIDLSPNALPDPGCEVRGCYGGYVPASGMNELRLERFKIGISGKDGFIPSDLDGILRLLKDIGERIASEAIKVHKITGADEIILAGGISAGEKGEELARASNEVIKNRYPEYSEKVKVTLSRSDIDFGGAIGAARYALAFKNNTYKSNQSKWILKYNIPDTTIGKKIIQPFFDELKDKRKKICLVTSEEIDSFLGKTPEHYPWFITLKTKNNLFQVVKNTAVEKLISFIDEGKYDVIIPIGGGTVIDWAKYAGSKTGKEVICIPSAISGNAMFTEKAIFYRYEIKDRTRESIVSGPPAKVIFDLEFIRCLLDYNPSNGIPAERANRAGAGDILSIHIALLDWKLAIEAGREDKDKVIYDKAREILDISLQNAEFIRDNTDLGMVLLIEMLAESSLLNMRFGTSRPKDGSEHLLADQIDKSLPLDIPRLHGEQVTIASLIMGYLYSTKYNVRPYTLIRNLAIALGLPIDPLFLGMQRDKIEEALQNVRLRTDKYTYFDRFGDRIDKKEAQSIFENVFVKKEIEDFRFEVCRNVNNSVNAMFDHVNDNVLPNMNSEKIKKMIDLLVETKQCNGRVIINASGRVGEIAVFFQQKLRALGFVVDDFKEITPEFLLNKNDLVLTFSGSGTTCSIVDNLANVHELHNKGLLEREIFSITARPNVETWLIGSDYHTVMEIQGRTKNDTNMEGSAEGDIYLPLSSTFEYSVMLFLEGIIELMIKCKNESYVLEKNIAVVSEIILETLMGIKEELRHKLLEHEDQTAKFVRLLKEAVDKNQSNELINKRRTYIFGLGQNNYVARLFARRIQNIGFEVYVPGPRDIISSSREGDIAIFISNSGKRGIMLRKIETAIREKCNTVVITADSNSILAKKCDEVNGIVIPISNRCTDTHTVDIMIDDEKGRKERANKRAFELAAMFYLEGISVALMNELQIKAEDLKHVAREWE